MVGRTVHVHVVRKEPRKERLPEMRKKGVETLYRGDGRRESGTH